MKHTPASGASFLKAYDCALKRISSDRDLVSVESDAGFILLDEGEIRPRKGYQVFVKIALYDEQLLKDKPQTGGLLENK